MSRDTRAFSELSTGNNLISLFRTLTVWLLAAVGAISSAHADYLQEKKVQVPVGDVHEACLELDKYRAVKYSFSSFPAAIFNIHYHDGDKAIYFEGPAENKKKEATFTAPRDQVYCWMWENKSKSAVNLKYAYQKITLKNQAKKGVPVYFRVNEKKTAIRILTRFGSQLTDIKPGGRVVNFAYSEAKDILAILTSSRDKALEIWKVGNQSLRGSFSGVKRPEFLAFSKKGDVLAIGGSSSETVSLINPETLTEIRALDVATPVLGLEASRAPVQLYVRTKEEILKMDFDLLKVVERNAKIPIKIGDKELRVNPFRWCFIHGTPHPLFDETPQAMTGEGIPGYLQPEFRVSAR